MSDIDISTSAELMMQIDLKMTGLVSSLDVVRSKQEEIADDITKIKDAVYHPDEGLYARIRALESWKSTSTRMMWILFTSFAGTIGAILMSRVA